MSAVVEMNIAPPNLLLLGHHDSGNAQRLLEVHGRNIRYCHPMKKFLVFNAKYWEIDEAGRIEKLAKTCMVDFLAQAVEHGNEAAQKFATTSLEAKRINGMLAMLKCEVPVSPDELDVNPFLLNFQNGTVDLATGNLGPHCREHLITKMIEHEYRPQARCPVFTSFLMRIMGAGPNATPAERRRAVRRVAWLRRALGYSLTGTTREKAVFFAWGGGNNGKTTLLATILTILGPYATLIQVDSLMVKQFGESNNSMADLADLRGARFVMTSETEEGQRLAEGKLKRLSQGMGRIKTCRKYENPFDFPETHKLWMDANHKPVIRGSDNAIWDRLYLIPFGETIPKNEIDPELPSKLLAEAEGILAWLVRGCARWQQRGLGKPPEVEAARRVWREESDPLNDFLDDECVLDPDLFCRTTSLWEQYVRWADRQKIRDPLKRKDFNERIRARGFKETSHRFADGEAKDWGERAWSGIALRVAL